MTARTLAAALDGLAAAATRAGVDADQARSEGEALAAAVAEPATGAYQAWGEELGRTPDATSFFAAASRGRRWRVSPTPLLSQLANTSAAGAGQYAAALASVCTAATGLGEPNEQVVAAAMGASAAQLGVAAPAGGHVTRPVSPPVSLPAAPPGADPFRLDPDLAEGLRASRDRLRAMEDFTAAGPGILSGVLDQLRDNAERLRALREGDGVVLPTRTPAPAGDLPAALPAEPVEQPVEQPAEPGPGAAAAATQGATGPAAPAPPPEKNLDDLLAELDGLVGLDSVKAEIHRQTAILRVEALRQKAGLKVPTITRHLVFVGNPGTGKTTVARLVGGIYRALGLLSKGQLVEVDRADLVAGYLGQTALKTEEVCKRAKGGVLFVDEAYALAGDSYGEEAINTLVKEMEDARGDLVVIVAGYPAPMATFISENPGLASRFRTTIVFEDYTDAELVEILTSMVRAADYDLGEGALDAFSGLLARQFRDETFGNGRFVRNVLEGAVGHQAWRLREVAEPTVADLRTLTAADVLGDAATPAAPLPAGAPGAPGAAT